MSSLSFAGCGYNEITAAQSQEAALITFNLYWANPGLPLPSSPNMLISLLDWELTEVGPCRLRICIPTAGTQYLSCKPFQNEFRGGYKILSTLSRVYLCTQCQSCGPHIWVKTSAFQLLQPSFPRSGACGCPLAKCYLKDPGHSFQAQSLFKFNCIRTLVFLVSSFQIFLKLDYLGQWKN